ncbi:DUF6873 family GME fold protein [Haloimpatiens sp. FM7315]|uniref:DUF6873 family GME fold protein n=1 Tax=Haloimpatiens sp. FM7315 TaxID=3298609 RepID=UPI0035A2E988
MKNFILVDFRIDSKEKNTLVNLGYEVLLCPPCNNLYDAVLGHPDMLLNIIDKNTIILNKDMNSSFIRILKNLNYKVLLSDSLVGSKYPYDIILNAVNTKEVFVHYLDYTDKSLLNSLGNKKIINVKQGYTKCSTAVVTDSAFITSDKGIYNSLIKENFDVLLVPSGDILLPSLDYGFIGGTCGLIEKNTMAFYGSLDYYKYGEEVKEFLRKHNVKPLYLREGKLIDRGSILKLG